LKIFCQIEIRITERGLDIALRIVHIKNKQRIILEDRSILLKPIYDRIDILDYVYICKNFNHGDELIYSGLSIVFFQEYHFKVNKEYRSGVYFNEKKDGL